jgi:hypothetical protein
VRIDTHCIIPFNAHMSFWPTGLVWHYMKARRHAMLVEALVRYEHAKNWGSGVPEMYEIRVAAPGSGTPAVDPWDAFVVSSSRLPLMPSPYTVTRPK